MPSRLQDVDVGNLRLGDLTPGASGASALLVEQHTVQTPWMRVASATTYDSGKTSVLLDADGATREWVAALEENMLQQLEAHVPDVRDSWKSSLTPDGWRLALTTQCERYGEKLSHTSPSRPLLLAAIVAVQGAWLWREGAGLKMQTKQAKVIGRTAPDS